MSAPETFDPTATAPTLGDLDLPLFSEGTLNQTTVKRTSKIY